MTPTTETPMSKFFPLFVLLLTILSPQGSPAQDTPATQPERAPDELTLNTEKVIVFKDGYAMVIKKARAVTDENGEVHTYDVPDAAVLGSFWAVPDEGTLVSMTAGWDDSTETHVVIEDCSTTLEILKGNLGKTCKIEINDRVIRGVILKVLSTSTPVARIPGSLEHESRLHVVSQTVEALQGSQFILRNDDGDHVLSAHGIQSLVIKDMSTSLEKSVTTKHRRKKLTFDFDTPHVERTFTIMYFRPGYRWIPTYRVHLDPEGHTGQADLSLQAEILNEAEDLDDVPIDIVVGVPHFKFKNDVSPLVLEGVMRHALQQAHPGLMAQTQSFSNSTYSLRPSEHRRQDTSALPAPKLPENLSAGGAGDLFIYHLPPMTLKKNQRTAVNILTARVGYKDVYTWDIMFKRQANDLSPAGQGVASPLKLSQNKIWHQIELVNTTAMPWTTGPVMIMSGPQPLGQDLLTYTSPRDAVRVPVTVSTDVRGMLSESESGRELNALKYDRRDYARIGKTLKLNVCNHKSSDILLEVTARFAGRATAATHEGIVTLDGHSPKYWSHFRGSEAVNNSSHIIWRTSLEPGELFEPTVEYHYYVMQ